MSPAIPLPRKPAAAPGDPVQQWYENELGWATAAGPPVQLVAGLRFDVLEVPADAGFAVLRRLGSAAATGPAALAGNTVRFLVAAGGADELPGLLEWLEWGGLVRDLRAVGAGGLIPAPLPPGRPGPREAAVWLRPPGPGRGVEPALPTLSALTGPRGHGAAPDLVRLVDTAATQCHRLRLLRASAQPLAFS
ncbi:SCO3374 family protein [Streptomyces sp. B-S-A8]|uniref:SCO3374 family protein n=1 Tax=Streptomyces solicavernae TaxID=3043614 RepID=A0ABT6RWX4_9ACTN|nr:SCO3374 family protein [Streptomyces sp. B-S-A8]MDI3388900.1 SCO3374 family protein [Streptomyces sp. B-S-A8]